MEERERSNSSLHEKNVLIQVVPSGLPTPYSPCTFEVGKVYNETYNRGERGWRKVVGQGSRVLGKLVQKMARLTNHQINLSLISTKRLLKKIYNLIRISDLKNC